MRKIRIFEHISLDGVISPGAPGEYGDGYAHGGWTAPYRTPAGLQLVLEAQGGSFDLLLGRRTAQEHAMRNGKHGDNPLSDLTIHGQHPFPADIEAMLLRINALGRSAQRWPLGENWPFSPRELECERGNELDGARRDLADFISMLEAGRGDEILIGPRTRKPFSNPL